jgi:hypothetical protein
MLRNQKLENFEEQFLELFEGLGQTTRSLWQLSRLAWEVFERGVRFFLRLLLSRPSLYRHDGPGERSEIDGNHLSNFAHLSQAPPRTF